LAEIAEIDIQIEKIGINVFAERYAGKLQVKRNAKKYFTHLPH
jgi:hypothetical protein